MSSPATAWGRESDPLLLQALGTFDSSLHFPLQFHVPQTLCFLKFHPTQNTLSLRIIFFCL